jgi:hypothetical protein
MYTTNPTKVPTDCRTGSTDEVDLSNARLLVADSHGIYIPQIFAQSIKREFVTGVSEEDYKILEAGPEHENYWDAWADVCDNASINDPVDGKCHLYQDGDLWVVPDPVEETVFGVRELGHTFYPMTESDWDGLAGADENSLIAHSDDAILIMSPKGVVSCIDHTGAEVEWWPKPVNF